MSEAEGGRVAEIVRLANCLKTESRVRMLLTLRQGASRPLDVIKQSGENPSTLYRVVDEMIEAGIVERSEPTQGEVHWRLTETGIRLLSSMEGVVSPGAAPAKVTRRLPWWAHMVVPAFVLLLSGAQAIREGMPGWILGGMILAVVAYMLTRRLLD
jgi:DNA-binding HxlR family transcriptional regulator